MTKETTRKQLYYQKLTNLYIFYLLSTVMCVHENIDYIYTYCANTHNPHLYSTKFVILASVPISITKIKVKAPLGKQSTSKVTYQQHTAAAFCVFHNLAFRVCIMITRSFNAHEVEKLI